MFNANNYGYNPYGRYIPQQPIEQFNNMQVNGQVSGQVRTSLQGKQVESIDVVKATDIPFDGSISYFPLIDGSAIITRQLQNDGTSKTIIFKPVVEEDKEQPKYITTDELNNAINKIDLSSIDDFREELNDLKKELRDLKKKKKED